MASRNTLPITKVARLNPGDKKGWPYVSGQVRPETFSRLEARRRSMGNPARSDLVELSIAFWLDHTRADLAA